MTIPTPPGGEQRRRSYAAGAAIARDQLRATDAVSADALDDVRAGDIVVVRGCYDQVEAVLDALSLPYTAVEPNQLPSVRLRPEQLLVVNCPGNVAPGSIAQIRAFVAAGGSLFTTDWALRHVIEPAFPGTIAYNERATCDDVVRITVADHENPFVQGVMDGGDDPQWWLEGSSYPIRIVDRDRVKVLVDSRELGDRYGEAPVVVQFAHGAGEVLHMISHYYMQRSELRTARHAAPATAYAAAKGSGQLVAAAPAMWDDLTVGDVESAASSARFLANVVASKKRRASTTGGRR
jgi:hypothetical protein